MPGEIEVLKKAWNRKLKGDVLVSGHELRHVTWQRRSTGSLEFDLMLGGGWPLNCWNEVVGVESSGKTTTILKMIAHQQVVDPDFHTVWVASEDFDPQWAALLGVDVDRMTFVMSNVMENVYDVCLAVQDEKAADCLILDSYPALVPDDEDGKAMDEYTVGKGALLTNKFFRKSYTALRRSLVAEDRSMLCIMVNQWRDRIGVIGHADPRTTPGGKGKNYSFMTRVDIARQEWIKNGSGAKVGQRIAATTVKNKTSQPQRKAVVDFYFDDHKSFHPGDYDTVKQVHSVAMAIDVIEQRGAWYYFGSEKWNGEKAVLAAMESDPLLVAALTTHVRHVLLGEGPAPLPYSKEIAPVAKRTRKVK